MRLHPRRAVTTTPILLSCASGLVPQHESRPEAVHIVRPADTNGNPGTTRVLQPGSTVATSLCEGEAARKHVFNLDVKGTKFRLSSEPLKAVRPFKLAETSLAADSGIDADAADASLRVMEYLRNKVRSV